MLKPPLIPQMASHLCKAGRKRIRVVPKYKETRMQWTYHAVSWADADPQYRPKVPAHFIPEAVRHLWATAAPTDPASPSSPAR